MFEWLEPWMIIVWVVCYLFTLGINFRRWEDTEPTIEVRAFAIVVLFFLWPIDLGYAWEDD